jgi:hypothetical protein
VEKLKYGTAYQPRAAWLARSLAPGLLHQGFDVPEAECLRLRMYYRFDGIPMLTPNYRRSAPIYDYALGEAVFHRLQPGLG